MKIEKLIAAIGEDKVRHQHILDSTTNIQSVKGGGSKVTFVTDALTPGDLVGKPRNVGIAFWFPKEDFDRVLAEERAKKNSQPNQS